jgi:hypothetical protein
MKNIICRLTVFFLLIISANAAEDWQKVIEKKFNFSFLSPGKISKEIDSLENDEGKIYSYTWNIENRDTNDYNEYFIQVVDLNYLKEVPDTTEETAISYLKGATSEIFPEERAYKLMVQVRSEFYGYLALTSDLLNDSLELYGRVFNFIVNNKLYNMVTIRSSENQFNKLTTEFFNGISLEGIERGNYKEKQLELATKLKLKFSKEPVVNNLSIETGVGNKMVSMKYDNSDSTRMVAGCEYFFDDLDFDLKTDSDSLAFFKKMALGSMATNQSFIQSSLKVFYKNHRGIEYQAYSEKNHFSGVYRYFLINKRVYMLWVQFTTPEIDREFVDAFFNSMEIIEE